MKAAVKLFLIAGLAGSVWSACSDAKARYIDLGSGEPVVLVKDESTGLMVNEETGKPVKIYVDTRTNDTVWGKSGKVINGEIRRSAKGQYVYISDDENDYKVKTDEDGSYKVKSGDDYKKKVEKDGDVKIKSGDRKVKIDGDDGERKVKVDD